MIFFKSLKALRLCFPSNKWKQSSLFGLLCIFKSIYQAKHLVNKGNGLPVGMHNSAIPQTSPVTTVLQQKNTVGRMASPFVCRLFSAVSKVFHQNVLIAAHRQRRLTHSFVLTHIQHFPLSTPQFFPPSKTVAMAPELNKAVSTN